MEGRATDSSGYQSLFHSSDRLAGIGNLKEEKFISVHSFIGFRAWSSGSKAEMPWQNSMAKANCSPSGGQQAEREERNRG